MGAPPGDAIGLERMTSLMLASSAFAPPESMPGWLQPFAEHQPISVATNAVRALTSGGAAGGDVAYAVAWTVGMLLVFIPLSARLYRKPA